MLMQPVVERAAGTGQHSAPVQAGSAAATGSSALPGDCVWSCSHFTAAWSEAAMQSILHSNSALITTKKVFYGGC